LTNARSIINKFDDLVLRTSVHTPDIIVVTETWFSNYHTNEIFNMGKYTLFRNDRLLRTGGGVCVWCKDMYKPRILNNARIKPDCIECLWLCVNSSIIMCVIYIPPARTTIEVDKIFEYVVNSYDELSIVHNITNFIILGDFNPRSNPSMTKHYIDRIIVSLGVSNIVKTSTRIGSSEPLDLILISDNLIDYLKEVCVYPSLKNYTANTFSDHMVVFADKHKTKTVNNKGYKYVFDYRKSHIDDFVNELNRVNWSTFYRDNNSDMETKTNNFYTNLAPALMKIPKEKVEINEYDVPWITPICKVIRKKADLAYLSGNIILSKHYESKLDKLIYEAKKKWSNKLLNSNSSGLWKMINNLKKNGNTNEEFKTYIRLSKDMNLQEYIDMLNAHFSSAFTSKDILSWKNLMTNLPDDDWCPVVTSLEVYNWLISAKCKGTGCDELSPYILKIAAPLISEPIAHLFNISIQERVVPNIWKMALIIGIPKKNSVMSAEDLRPISVLPVISRIFEIFLLKHLNSVFEIEMGNNQYAYRKNSSTTCLAIRIHDTITKWMDMADTKFTKILSFDLSRAFERVPHINLIQCLNDKSFPKGFIKWIASYLDNRAQKVSVLGNSSVISAVSSSVAQGSVFGPKLFSVYVSTLNTKYSDTLLVKFADDITIVYPFKNVERDSVYFKNEINNILKWTSDNGLLINNGKSAQLNIVKWNYKLDVPSFDYKVHGVIRILGFYFNNNLTWSDHVDIIVGKASQRLFILKKLRQFLDSTQLLAVYHALIRSLLEYGCPLFFGLCATTSDRLNKIQKRALNIINYNNSHIVSSADLVSRREKLAMKLFNDIKIVTHILHDLAPNNFNSRTGKCNVIYCKTSRRQRSFVPLCTLFINNFA
jgi:hypothetical protein